MNRPLRNFWLRHRFYIIPYITLAICFSIGGIMGGGGLLGDAPIVTTGGVLLILAGLLQMAQLELISRNMTYTAPTADPPAADDVVRDRYIPGGVPLYVMDMFAMKLGKPVNALAVGNDGGSIDVTDLPPGTIGWMGLKDVTRAPTPGTTYVPRTAVLRSRWHKAAPFALYMSDGGKLYGLIFGDDYVAEPTLIIELDNEHVVEVAYLGAVGDEPLR